MEKLTLPSNERPTLQSSTFVIHVVRMPHYPEGYDLPAYETPQSAGMDIRAAIEEPLPIQPGDRVLVPTALKMQIPKGFHVTIRPRSGLAYRQGITVLNAPGTIDADYRGEVKVLLYNTSQEAYTIDPAERIAQMVLEVNARAPWNEVDQLTKTRRADGGFGSTGAV